MSNGTIEFFMKHPELLGRLSKEQLEGMMELVRVEKAKLKQGGSWLPQSAADAMTAAVDDKLMSDIVGDARRTNSPGWLKPKEGGAAVERGSGWTPLDPIGPPSGIRYVDEMCQAQDVLDRAERMKGFGLAGLGGPRVLTKE